MSLLSCLSRSHSWYQLSDVAEGLYYLHSRDVIHGDLKGVRACPKSCFAAVLTPGQRNVVIDNTGHARIAGFGRATLAQTLGYERSIEYQHGHGARWTAPEVLGGKPYSKEADIFSFAMVMIEVRHARVTMC